MKNSKKNLIVGAGLSGAVIANKIATELNESVVVIDKRFHIAGNIYDYNDSSTNITVQKYGPHIFHTNNKKIWDFLSKFTDWNYFIFKPKAFIEGNFVSIPFSLTTLYEIFSSNMAKIFENKLISKYGYGTKISILELKKNRDKDLTFLADYIYKNMFEGYTVKQWDVEPEKIDPGILARVPIYISFDSRYFQDRYQGIPQSGYTKMVEKMLNNSNIELKLNTDFKNINKEEFDRIVYSGSIDEFFDYKYGKLPYRSLKFDIKTIDREYYLKSAMTNFPNNYDFTRITEHKYFLNEKSDKTVISIEYPEEFELNVNERYYPIETDKNKNLYNKYLEEAGLHKNLFFVGRLGKYKYYNMDLVIEEALRVFDEEINI